MRRNPPDTFTLLPLAKVEAMRDTLMEFGASAVFPEALRAGTNAREAEDFYEMRVGQVLARLRAEVATCDHIRAGAVCLACGAREVSQ